MDSKSRNACVNFLRIPSTSATLTWSLPARLITFCASPPTDSSDRLNPSVLNSSSEPLKAFWNTAMLLLSARLGKTCELAISIASR